MEQPKQEVAAAISRAQTDLDVALSALDHVQEIDPASIEFHTHSLNNFLTVSTATIELLQMMFSGQANPQAQSLLDGLAHTNRLMAHSIRQLQSQNSSKEVPLRSAPLDMTIMARRACHYYQRVAELKNIRVTGEIASDIPITLSDSVAVGAILENLLSNAVKYSPQDRGIWLRVENHGDMIQVTVEDQGPGLSADDQARLFECGAVLTPKPTAGEKSRGYGLAVAKSLAEKLGGSIGCDSKVGVGSKFWFRLPVVPPEVSAMNDSNTGANSEFVNEKNRVDMPTGN